MSKLRKRKLYHEDSIAYAIELISDGVSLNKAAKISHVPEATLRWRVKNGKPGKVGKELLLDSKDEDDLVRYITFMSDIGHPVTPGWVMETAGRFAQKRYSLWSILQLIYCQKLSKKCRKSVHVCMIVKTFQLSS